MQAGAAVTVSDRVYLYQSLQLVGVPFKLCHECATVGLESFLEQQAALYGMDTSKADDFTKPKAKKTQAGDTVPKK